MAPAQDAAILTGFSVVNSWYNSMAFTFRKPFSHGLEVVANYTFANATDGGQVSGVNGTFNGTDTPVDPANLKAEYGRSDLDMRERFVGSLVYAPKLNFISSAPLRYIANGWMISGAATEQTGFPLTAAMSNYPSGAPDGGVTGAELSLFNSATGGRAPQVPRNGFAGPGVRNIDARITRDFPIHETIELEILGEAFNLLNHQNVLGVNTTAFSYAAADRASVRAIPTPASTPTLPSPSEPPPPPAATFTEPATAGLRQTVLLARTAARQHKTPVCFLADRGVVSVGEFWSGPPRRSTRPLQFSGPPARNVTTRSTMCESSCSYALYDADQPSSACS